MSRIDDPNGDPIPGILERLNALEKQNPLESGSVRSGRVRFIGGLLRIDAGGRVEIVGTLQVDGTSTVTGQFNVNGPFNLAGNGTITGDLTITGPVTISGDVDLTGIMRVTGDIEIIGPGKIKIGDIVVEGGKIKAGNVEVELNKITVGGGSSPATLRDGALSFGTGGTVAADVSNNGVRMAVGANQVYVGTGAASIQVGSQSMLVTSSGVFFPNLQTTPKSLTPEDNPIGSVFADGSGRIYRVVAG